MNQTLVEVRNLEVEYATRVGLVRAVDRVGLDVYCGETLGLVGESGCGKSTLGLSIMRLVPPPGRIVGGEIWFDHENLMDKSEEEMRRIRGRRISMIFQDPMTSLNPLERIGDHIVETIRTHEPEVSRAEAWRRAEGLADRLGISPSRRKDYPHQFSGGMRQRIMIGLALALNADLIIADEPTTSLDVIVEAQFLDFLKELKQAYNLTLILITHNMGVVAELSDRVAVMYAAKVVEVADTVPLYEDPLHPYTQGLLRCIPNISLVQQKLETMPGSPPDLVNPPPGCRFHPRCPYVMEVCTREEPALKEVKPGRWTACWLY